MKEINIFGYIVMDNGIILKLDGNPIKYQKNIKVVWKDKKVREVSYSRFVYYAFNQNTFDFDNHDIVIRHKDGNSKNNDIKNLYAIKRKDFLQGEKNKCHKLTDKDIEEIKLIYMDNITKDHNPNKNISYRQIANKYGVSHTLIRGIIIGQFRNKNNYKLK